MPQHTPTGTPLFDPNADRVIPGVGADSSFADLNQDPALYKALYLKSIGLDGTGPRSRHDEWRANRFNDVQAQYAFDRAGLYGFGARDDGGQTVTEGRTFQEYLDLIKGADNQYGGYNTNTNLRNIQDLSDQGVMELRQNIADQGLNANDIMNQAFQNATTARFGRNYGRNIAQRATGQRTQFAATQEGQNEQSFTRQLLDQLRRQFGIEIAPRSNSAVALRGMAPMTA